MGAFRSRPPITSWGMGVREGVRGDHKRKGGWRGNAPLHSLCLLLPLYPDDQYPEASSCQPCRPACLLTPSFLTLTLVEKKKYETGFFHTNRRRRPLPEVPPPNNLNKARIELQDGGSGTRQAPPLLAPPAVLHFDTTQNREKDKFV